MAEHMGEETFLHQKNRRKRAHCENNLPETVNTLSYEDYICPICLQLLIEPVVMPCKHELCKLCFTQNVQEANLQCPICRIRISSWARKQARNGTLICQERWKLIQKLFPENCERRLRGADDEDEDFYRHRPLKRIISENGEIRSEYEEERRKIQQAREEECRASEEFIQRLMEEEKNVNREMELLKEKDEKIARKIHKEINEIPVATPFKTVCNKQLSSASKGKITRKISNRVTLERWFSPSSNSKNSSGHNSDQNQNINQSIKTHQHPTARSNIYKDYDTKELELKYKQEEDDFALALKLQQQFDKERQQEQQVERKRGTVDGYMLRSDPACSCTSL